MLSCLVPRFGQEDMPSSTKFDLQCKKDSLNIHFAMISLFLSCLCLERNFILVPSQARFFPFSLNFLGARRRKAKSLASVLGKVVVKNGRKQFYMFVALSAS